MEHCWKVHVENNELMLDLGRRCLEGVVVMVLGGWSEVGVIAKQRLLFRPHFLSTVHREE